MWKDQKKYLDEKYSDFLNEVKLNYYLYTREEKKAIHKLCNKYGIPISYIREIAVNPEPQN